MRTMTLKRWSQSVLAILAVCVLIASIPVFAQDVPVEAVAAAVEAPAPVVVAPVPVPVPAPAPVSSSFLKKMIDLVANSLLPALWVACGPLAVKGITMFVNSWTTTYVPRGLQVPLAAILGGVVAGLTGDAAGIDPAVATSIGGGAGIIAQILTSLHPDTMHASAPVAKTAAALIPKSLPVILLAIFALGLTACVSDMDLGNGRVMTLKKVEHRSAFGVNDSRSRLADCIKARDEQDLTSYVYTDCHWMESEWRQSSSPGQGGQIVHGALQGIGLGVAGTMIGGTSNSATAGANASSSTSVTVPAMGGHR